MPLRAQPAFLHIKQPSCTSKTTPNSEFQHSKHQKHPLAQIFSILHIKNSSQKPDFHHSPHQKQLPNPDFQHYKIPISSTYINPNQLLPLPQNFKPLKIHTHQLLFIQKFHPLFISTSLIQHSPLSSGINEHQLATSDIPFSMGKDQTLQFKVPFSFILHG